ncbi:hypothetical protein KBX37_14700 [Micromonospora sp. U56]|uniref:hypothetical protein n=1 Tax=Micromonospora sp. U56 TaxID=2824900 RepID=UPI001B37A938|nr:hypothetical protein [Micromonospora sp. U56]MBQ0894332.1 hypothetical protein [Micromonospora sp. U56]
MATRWDAPLYELSVEFASTVRVFRHLATRMKGAPDPAVQHDRTEEERQRLLALLEQIRLVGDERVQRAARMVVRHFWAVLRVGEGHEDIRAGEFGGVPPETRLSTSLHEFIPCGAGAAAGARPGTHRLGQARRLAGADRRSATVPHRPAAPLRRPTAVPTVAACADPFTTSARQGPQEAPGGDADNVMARARLYPTYNEFRYSGP